ncbi:hypothetical protein WH47_04708 [Habropoda laboriosa]|uniref:Uncharacterized protein n=1 Tax=Habropoda laboriosa TaxID=597456 RepID=A0A0L7R2Q7_9HYME|nr:hypothetical protein WH47_04708 [Habropoda laboriosa]
MTGKFGSLLAWLPEDLLLETTNRHEEASGLLETAEGGDVWFFWEGVNSPPLTCSASRRPRIHIGYYQSKQTELSPRQSGLRKPVEGGARDASEEQDPLRSRGSSRSRDREVALTPLYPPPPSNAPACILFICEGFAKPARETKARCYSTMRNATAVCLLGGNSVETSPRTVQRKEDLFFWRADLCEDEWRVCSRICNEAMVRYRVSYVALGSSGSYEGEGVK